jgi:hypothetical protein
MDFYTKTNEMKNNLTKWKNLLMISLVLSSLISLVTICISVAIFDNLKKVEHKLYMIEQKIKP